MSRLMRDVSPETYVLNPDTSLSAFQAAFCAVSRRKCGSRTVAGGTAIGSTRASVGPTLRDFVPPGTSSRSSVIGLSFGAIDVPVGLRRLNRVGLRNGAKAVSTTSSGRRSRASGRSRPRCEGFGRCGSRNRGTQRSSVRTVRTGSHRSCRSESERGWLSAIAANLSCWSSRRSRTSPARGAATRAAAG